MPSGSLVLQSFTLPTPFGEALCRLDEQGALVELKLVDSVDSSPIAPAGQPPTDTSTPAPGEALIPTPAPDSLSSSIAANETQLQCTTSQPTKSECEVEGEGEGGVGGASSHSVRTAGLRHVQDERRGGAAAGHGSKTVGEGHVESEPDQELAARVAEVRRQLVEYFAGERREFDLPLNPQGTEFQQRVWNELSRIPYGTTVTYSGLAARLGDPKAVRAVGSANGANPIWVIIPCHRVVGADGSLTGYAGGIEVKRLLLVLEGALSRGLF